MPSSRLTRRRALKLGVTALTPALGGCGSNGLSAALDTSPTPTPRRQRAHGNALDVEVRLDADSVDYYPAADEIRVRTNAYMDLTEYLARRCTDEAVGAVGDAIHDQFDKPLKDLTGHHTVGAMGPPGNRTGISVAYGDIRDRDSTLRATPNVPYDRFRNNTPRTVTATVTFRDTTYVCTYPVYVRQTDFQYASGGTR